MPPDGGGGGGGMFNTRCDWTQLHRHLYTAELCNLALTVNSLLASCYLGYKPALCTIVSCVSLSVS